MLCITDPSNNKITTVLSKHGLTIYNHILPTDKNRWIRKDTYKWETVVADTLFSLEYKNYKKDKKDLVIKTSNAKAVIKNRLGVKPNDVNYKALQKIIDKNGVTDFGYDVICSILDSGVRGQLILKGKNLTMYIKKEEAMHDYILSKPFEYSASYGNKKFSANFYVLMFDGEITLLRVGRDKVQVGFYDITNSKFLKEVYNGREAHKIFENYLPTYGSEDDIVNSKYIGNKNDTSYRFYNNKASLTINYFWLYVPENSKFMKKLANGLDTLNGIKTGEFGTIYLKNETIPKKDNNFVLGEIFGHAYNIDGNSSIVPNKFAGGEFRPRLWIADVENPSTVSSNLSTLIRQAFQNEGWQYYSTIRIISKNYNMGVIEE